jgi:hypothetical protein
MRPRTRAGCIRRPPPALEVVSVRVDEVRFLNATEAALYYDIVLPGYAIPEFPNRIGRAVLVDGK